MKMFIDIVIVSNFKQENIPNTFFFSLISHWVP